jgi:2-oxoglutarate dehydrogenase E2 component (dihydrolipoamide succinyltransferase)
MSTKVEVPDMGESIAEAVIIRWMKQEGDTVAIDEAICELETDKATFDLPAPTSGTLRPLKGAGETVRVGEVVAEIGEARPAGKSPAAPQADAKKAAPAPAAAKNDVSGGHYGSSNEPSSVDATATERPPVAPRTVPATAKEMEEPVHVVQRLATEPAESDVTAAAESKGQENHSRENGSVSAVALSKPALPPAMPSKGLTLPAKPPRASSGSGVRREPMTKIRRRIAERLVRAQHTAAMLTTFNEVDMTAVMDLRARHKEQFTEKHGVSLGLMSFFAKATVLALKQYPVVNAQIDGDDIVYHDHVHLAVAVNTDRGLVVPVLRNVEEMSFGEFEAEIKRVAIAARDGKLSLQELSGGTFTITNGGVFGSLLSTPILNPPQSGILGMHTIQKRPMVVNDQIVARPMMYVALSYDHRLVDGRDAVQFLVTLKSLLEEPMKMILDI